MTGDLNVTGLSSLNGNANVADDLDVTGASSLNGNANVGGDLDVTGASSLNGNAIVGGDLEVTGVSSIAGSLGVGTTNTGGHKLKVTGGNVCLDGDLEVTGVSSFTGAVGVGTTNTGGHKLKVTGGSVCLDEELRVNGTGASSIAGSLGIGTNNTLGHRLWVGAGTVWLDGELKVKGTGISTIRGKLGVGTTVPREKFEVVGNIRAERFIGFGGDYAEYFESDEGVEIPVGVSAGVNGKGKIRPAKKGETPIGVISKNPSLLGNSPSDWPGKYLRDEFGNVIMDEVRKEIMAPKKEKESGEGETEMAGTGEFTLERTPRLNPDYDPSRPYVDRGKRPEWHCVGVMGQIPMRKGQPAAPTWVKIKDISKNVELWLVK